MGYSALKSELDLSSAMKAHLERGGVLILPRINRARNALDLYRITDFARQTIAGVWGIREPDPAVCETATAAEIDLVLIPGAAFDRQGNRLGYGAGFYDRLLAHPNFKGQIAACLFQEQLVDSIPVEAHDIPAHILISDQGVIKDV
jgi:5-formyltetrahydrofolate cyclo-ligase